MAALVLYMPEPSSVKLIGCSPPSWMVQVALREKEVAHDVVALDDSAGGYKQGRVAELNPRHTVPVLEHRGAVLTEALAMLQHIEQSHPEPPLMPRHLPSSAVALDRFHACAGLQRAGMNLFGYLMRSSPEERDTIRIDAMLSAFHEHLGRAEGWYAEADHAAGDAFSLVDIVVLSYVAPAVQLGLNLASRYPALAAAFDRDKERPSVVETWPKGWKKPFDLLS